MSTPQDLRVTLVQAPLTWEDRTANLQAFEQRLQGLETDLVVLPEMFSTGFTMRPAEVAETMDGPALEWMRKQAAQLQAVVMGSLSMREGERFVNRLCWVRPDGSLDTYDKRHLFRMGEENNHYSGGKDRLITELKGWRFCPLVCYDLRFPVWSRNRTLNPDPENLDIEYDVLLYVANWPKVRRSAWSSLLVARSIENQCYTIAVNRVGADGNGVDHSGDSVAIDPKGDTLSNLTPDQGGVETVTLSYTDLTAFRKKFPVALDADIFDIL